MEIKIGNWVKEKKMNCKTFFSLTVKIEEKEEKKISNVTMLARLISNQAKISRVFKIFF